MTDEKQLLSTADATVKTTVTDDDWKKLIPADFTGTIDIPMDGSAPVVTQAAANRPAEMQSGTPSAENDSAATVTAPFPVDPELEALLWGGTPAGPTIEYGQDYVVTRGDPLPEGAPQATNEELVAAVSSVDDPELMLNVYDLGLIYRLDKLANGDVEVDMTVTAAGCPVAGLMPNQVADALADLKGVGRITVKLVWEPAWTIDRMSENARYQLDMF